MSTITTPTASLECEILRADLTLQTGRDAVRPLGTPAVVARPGLNRGLGGTLDLLALTWTDAYALMNALLAPFTLTEPTLGFDSAPFTPVGDPKAASQTLFGVPAAWTVSIEVTA